MGLFKKNKFDEFKEKLDNIHSSEWFDNYWKENVVETGEMPFDNYETLESVIITIKKNGGEISEYFPEARNLYDVIVYDNNNKVQIKIFLNFLILSIKSSIDIQDITNMLSFFNNKELLLTLTSKLIANKKIEHITYEEFVSYMFQIRQYYVDENAFLVDCIDYVDKIKLNFPFDDPSKEIIDKKISEARQMAGIYDVDSNEVQELLNKYFSLKKTSDDICEKVNMSKTKIENLILKTTINNRLSENAKEEILKEINKYKDVILNETNTMVEQISNEGKKYLDLIAQQLEKHPEVKTKLEEKHSTDKIKEFDDNISAIERFENIKNKKNKGLYHYCFDDVLKQLLINKSVYLVGPGGSGKTTIVTQIAKLLNLKLYNIGFVADEFTTIKGYMDANGNFVKTPFYTAFKEGGIFFLDEIDNSESKALIELNKFVTNDGYMPYLFPNDEIVEPHPNFRLIAAGNTWGDGADISYSTRENLDSSTLRRFSQIYCGFDKELEEKMFDCNDKEMFDFCMSFREALIEREGNDEFSTGDLSDINSYIKSNLFTKEEIIKLKFIKNRREETLQNIISIMEQNLNNNKYLELFNTMLKENGKEYVKTRK